MHFTPECGLPWLMASSPIDLDPLVRSNDHPAG